MLPKIRIDEVSHALMQPRFEAALRRRVGRGLTARVELAREIGCDERTVDGWLNEGRMPPLYLYWRLVAYFGPAFEIEIMEGIEIDGPGVSVADVVAVHRALGDALEKLTPAVEGGDLKLTVLDEARRA